MKSEDGGGGGRGGGDNCWADGCTNGIYGVATAWPVKCVPMRFYVQGPKHALRIRAVIAGSNHIATM